MIVTCVHVWVLPAHLEAFEEATLANHRASVQEPGNLRFDLLKVPREPGLGSRSGLEGQPAAAGQPGQYMIYEAYLSEEAAAAHKETAHYKAWRLAVEPWMAQPRQGVKYQVVAPTALAAWGKVPA